MYCTDTNASLPAIRLEHLDVKTATRLNDKIGKLKQARIWNAVIRLFVSGGHVEEQIETCKVVKLPDD